MFSDGFLEKFCKDGVIYGYSVTVITPNDALYIHTGVGELEINGQTYVGTGELLSIGDLSNVSDANPASMEISLAGIPTNAYNVILSQRIRGSTVKVGMMLYDEDGQILDHEFMMVGQVTSYGHSLSETEGSISLEVADEFNLYERPLQRFCTDESFKRSFPGDRFMRYVAQLAGLTLRWGNDADAAKFTKN